MRQQPLQWHPAFQAAMQIELAEYQAWLKYEREHNLTQKPLQIDLLIIKMEQVHSARIIQAFPGIFYAEGLMFPLQLIQNSALPKKENIWLSRLRPGLDVEEDIAVLAQAYQGRDENPLYSAVMELIVRANKKQYEEAKHMCEALRELFADEIEEGRQKGKAEGKIEGKIEGKAEGQCLALIEILRRKVENGKTLEESAEALEEQPEYIEKLYRLIESQGPDTDSEVIYQLYKKQER